MTNVNILAIQPVSAAERARIEGVDARVRLTDAGGWFDGEIRESWPEFTTRRYLRADASGKGTRAERDALLGDAEIVLGGFPFPLDLRGRAPKLKWFHQRPAGASNLVIGDLWRSDVIVTTSRGYANSLPIAEYVLGAIVYFAKGLYHAAVDRQTGTFDHRAYRPLILEGKTVCVVGAGGIGRAVGKLCAAAGMRVVGTRRHPPKSKAELSEGFADLRGAHELHALLGESDFVAVCCQWTPETTDLIGSAAFDAMKKGAVVVNVARGEIVDEDALVAALQSGKLRGAALDVYVGEFEREPDSRLWSDPRVLITPHTSAASDESRHRAIELFCKNLRAYLDGRPLENVVDWDLGY
jgi:phosphoglycerate dehydrogenase-like enzyme